MRKGLFSKWQKIIGLLSILVNIIPKSILNILWNITDGSESKLCILFRYLYLKKYTNYIGKNVFIGKYVTLKNIKGLKIGNNVSLHAYSYVDAYGTIEIGDNVSIANHASIISFDHTWNDSNLPIKYNIVEKKPIRIESDVWIGNGVRILGNSHIKTRNVIAAGAVVNKSTLRNRLYGGVPIKEIKEI